MRTGLAEPAEPLPAWSGVGGSAGSDLACVLGDEPGAEACGRDRLPWPGVLGIGGREREVERATPVGESGISGATRRNKAALELENGISTGGRVRKGRKNREQTCKSSE